MKAAPRHISTVFNNMGQSLLILGQPGSGKTTTLLALAKHLIKQVKNNPALPIPVIFNLSSWATSQLPLKQWLIFELKEQYNIPKKLASSWLKNEQLMIFLDGLDEVALNKREACIQAINKFRTNFLGSVVVCSRLQDYEILNTKLKLHGAIVLQPLTPAQVNQYLAKTGNLLQAVKKTLVNDKPLQELVSTPLMLSIVTLAYKGLSIDELQHLDTVDSRRKHIFETYITRMFAHDKDKTYSPKQTTYWLSWLAYQMAHHNQTIFRLEKLQPTWLQTKNQWKTYKNTVGLSGGLIFGLSGVLSVVLIIMLSNGLIGGLIGKLIGGLSGVLIGGLMVGLIGGLSPKIKLPEILKWSGITKEVLIFGLSGGLIFGLICRLIGVLINGLNVRLIDGLSVGLFSGLIVGLIVGLSKESLETRLVPNQGIYHSAENIIKLILITGLIVGLSVGSIYGLRVGLIFGLIFGLIIGLIGGLDDLIKYYTLRYTLYKEGYTPKKYVKFLDYATKLLFLRKVGGGYIFIHRLLLEYFAKHWKDNDKEEGLNN